MSINSKYCKAVLFSYYRFTYQVGYIASECGQFNSDMLLVDKDSLIEVEIKTSFADFKNDFKKDKHVIFNRSLKENYIKMGLDKKQHLFKPYKKRYGRDHKLVRLFKIDMAFIPNKFYFAVPTKLVPRCSEFLKNNYPQYGLIEILEEVMHWEKRAKVIRKAKLLHNRKAHSVTKKYIVNRMSSELANLWQKRIK